MGSFALFRRSAFGLLGRSLVVFIRIRSHLSLQLAGTRGVQHFISTRISNIDGSCCFGPRPAIETRTRPESPKGVTSPTHLRSISALRRLQPSMLLLIGIERPIVGWNEYDIVLFNLFIVAARAWPDENLTPAQVDFVLVN